MAGECSVTCGTGVRINSRSKEITESNGGTCDGCDIQIQGCSMEECDHTFHKEEPSGKCTPTGMSLRISVLFF